MKYCWNGTFHPWNEIFDLFLIHFTTEMSHFTVISPSFHLISLFGRNRLKWLETSWNGHEMDPKLMISPLNWIVWICWCMGMCHFTAFHLHFTRLVAPWGGTGYFYVTGPWAGGGGFFFFVFWFNLLYLFVVFDLLYLVDSVGGWVLFWLILTDVVVYSVGGWVSFYLFVCMSFFLTFLVTLTNRER